MPPKTATLSELVVRARVVLGLSQQQLATRARLGLSTVQKIEQGITVEPTRKVLLKLEGALGVELLHRRE